MSRNGVARLRLEYARELGVEMVHFDELILRAEAAGRALDAFDLELMRDMVMHTRMAILRRHWEDQRQSARAALVR